MPWEEKVLSANPLAFPIEMALATVQTSLGVVTRDVMKYQAAVAPFASVSDDSPETLSQLRNLMAPGETCFYIRNFVTTRVDGLPPPVPGLRFRAAYETVQMIWPEHQPVFPSDLSGLEPLTCAQAGEMLELIAIAFPGLFRAETCRMGPYFGVRGAPGTSQAGKLVAMAGDRFCLRTPEGVEWREISGVCTHPDYAGQGLATRLLAAKLQEHRAAGARSFLHTAVDNTRAIGVYERLGFLRERTFPLQGVMRERDEDTQ